MLVKLCNIFCVLRFYFHFICVNFSVNVSYKRSWYFSAEEDLKILKISHFSFIEIFTFGHVFSPPFLWEFFACGFPILPIFFQF